MSELQSVERILDDESRALEKRLRGQAHARSIQERAQLQLLEKESSLRAKLESAGGTRGQVLLKVGSLRRHLFTLRRASTPHIYLVGNRCLLAHSPVSQKAGCVDRCDRGDLCTSCDAGRYADQRREAAVREKEIPPQTTPRFAVCYREAAVILTVQ